MYHRAQNEISSVMRDTIEFDSHAFHLRWAAHETCPSASRGGVVHSRLDSSSNLAQANGLKLILTIPQVQDSPGKRPIGSSPSAAMSFLHPIKSVVLSVLDFDPVL